MYVKVLLRDKGAEVSCVQHDISVEHALTMMVRKNIGCLVVMNQGRITGLFTERDYARNFISSTKSTAETQVSEIMTKDLVFVDPEVTINDCMALMTEKRVRHLPVLEGDKLVGIISIGDVVKSIIEEQEHTIEDLNRYIQGSY